MKQQKLLKEEKKPEQLIASDSYRFENNNPYNVFAFMGEDQQGASVGQFPPTPSCLHQRVK